MYSFEGTNLQVMKAEPQGALMRPLGLTLLLALPTAGAPRLPDDKTMMAEMKLDKSYEAMQNLMPRIEASVREVTALRDSYSGVAGPDPGGVPRMEARERLEALRRDLVKERSSFNRLEEKKRALSTAAILAAMNIYQGKNDEANKSLQQGYRQIQIAQDTKALMRQIEILLKEEAAAHEEAVARWQSQEDARTHRKRLAQGAGAAALLIPAGLFFARRRRRLALEAADGERLGRWRVSKAPKPWMYGTRFDDADGGSGTSASVRLFDERLCAPPSSAPKLLSALRAAAPPKHPAIAAQIEAFEAGGSVVLVYPPTAAKPLSLWLEEGRRVPPAQAVLFLRRLAPALDAAHRAGRAHGALGPESVLVGGDSGVTLEDFGVVSALAAAGASVAPLPSYCAPEAALGAPPADLYSLGVILYELMTGRHPFEGTNLQVMKAEKRYAPLSRMAPGCPPALGALLDGLLEPDPARRRPAPGGLEASLRGLG